LRYILLPIIALSLLAMPGCAGRKTQSEADLAEQALNRGLQAHAAGRLQHAATDYREVLVHDPRNKYAYYNLGLIDQVNGHAQSAENNYRLALNIDPDFAPALFNLAILRFNAGATQEAIDLYRHVIQVQPDNA